MAVRIAPPTTGGRQVSDAMDPIRQSPRLDGMLGVVGRLLAPADVISGRLTSLLGIL